MGEGGEAEEITISGDDMQRWVLKIFLNHAVTEHFAEQQNNTLRVGTISSADGGSRYALPERAALSGPLPSASKWKAGELAPSMRGL